MRMYNPSGLVLNHVHNVRTFTEKFAFDISEEVLELDFEKHGRRDQVCPYRFDQEGGFCRTSGQVWEPGNVTIKVGGPMRATTAMASNCFLLLLTCDP